jgi:hypothetical protein
MDTDNSLSIEQWGDIFKYFQQVENVKIDSSAKRLDITIRGKNNILQATNAELDNSLCKFNGNPHEVVTNFLRKHDIFVYYQDTLVGFFDIQAYSAFIEETSIDEAIKKLNGLFSETRSVAIADILAVKLDHWILSDSIILVVDTSRHPLFEGSLEYFLGTCSSVMQYAMLHGFPLRGAIGGGYFHKDGEIMVSSGLVDAAQYEKKQNWLGAILTPSALQLVEKASKLGNDLKGKPDIDLLSDRFIPYVRYGVIPWKDEGKDENQKIEKPNETYYIKPFEMADKDWASKYLPCYFNKQSKIDNSNRLYAQA